MTAPAPLGNAIQLFYANARTLSAQIEAAIVAKDPAMAHHPAPRPGPINMVTNRRDLVSDGVYVRAVDSARLNVNATSVSWDNRECPAVFLTTVRHAGEIITAETHKLATPEEVERFKAYSAENLNIRQREDAKGAKIGTSIAIPGAR